MTFGYKKSLEPDQTDHRTSKRKIGDIGENAVAEYLKSKDFEVFETNYLKKWGEIDIVARKDKKLHFIEVKSISREIHNTIVSQETKSDISREIKDVYRAEDNLHSHKLERLRRAIQTYLLDRHLPENIQWQFDVATVLVDQEKRLCKVSFLWDIIL